MREKKRNKSRQILLGGNTGARVRYFIKFKDITLLKFRMCGGDGGGIQYGRTEYQKSLTCVNLYVRTFDDDRGR